MSGALYAVVAEFATPESLAAAARHVRSAGFRRIETYAPYAVEEDADRRGRALPAIVLAGGLIGALLGVLMQWAPSVLLYPLNVGGRPLASWPAFGPIAFEIAVLCAVAAGFFGFFALNRLPLLYHPVFRAPDFARASQDRFFLSVAAADPAFDRDAVLALLETCRPIRVTEVAP